MSERKFKPTTMWALSNGGILWSVHELRKYAIKEAEDTTGEPWSCCKEYLEVTKVNIFPFDGGPRLKDWRGR